MPGKANAMIVVLWLWKKTARQVEMATASRRPQITLIIEANFSLCRPVGPTERVARLNQ